MNCKMKVTKTKCQCRACGEFFNSVAAFDKHRVFSGDKPDWTTRKCDTSNLIKNAKGYWVSGIMPKLAYSDRSI